jgi:hypothetical protein
VRQPENYDVGFGRLERLRRGRKELFPNGLHLGRNRRSIEMDRKRQEKWLARVIYREKECVTERRVRHPVIKKCDKDGDDVRFPSGLPSFTKSETTS